MPLRKKLTRYLQLSEFPTNATHLRDTRLALIFRLVEASGLKGFRIGDASVSQKHANFIINHGNARAADLERLIEHVQETVERLHGVRLTPEVRVMGAAA